jgi:signal transduction histidine kinase
MIDRFNSLSTRQAADILLAVGFAGISQLEVWVFILGEGYGIGTRIGASLFTLLASAALAWRRSRPNLAYWANSVGIVGTIVVGLPGDIYQWTSLVAMYSVGAYGTDPQRWIALLAGVGGVLFYFFRFPSEGDPLLVGLIVAIAVMGWLTGRMYGARLDEIQLRQEMELSQRLAVAQEQRLALEEERIRIARDLHDIIGHTVNVMVVHAGAGRREIGGDQTLVKQAFDTIEGTGRAALSELDRVLALLRGDEEDAERLPTPGLGDLDALAATFSDTGLEVEVAMSGSPQSVPASVGLAAYRIVQEALTNTLRHGAARMAKVAVAAGETSVDVSVVDDGVGDPTTIEPGRGITGMRERAALHGGSLALQRADDAGVQVRATLTWENDQS